MDTQLYSTAEAIFHVLEPQIDSEIEDLDDGDEENDEPESLSIVLPQRIRDSACTAPEEEPVENLLDESAESATSQDAIAAELPLYFSDHVFRWRSMTAPQTGSTSVEETNFSLPPDNSDEMTPLNYFNIFWNPDLNEYIADQTNLYAMRKKCTAISTTQGEIEQFIGMQMLMSIVQLPKYEMYWANETRYAAIADVMSRNKYKSLRRFLHFNDNSLLDDEENTKNKLFKIQPIIDHVKNNCRKIEPEIEQSIDEQIIPAKNFVRSGRSGLMYDFFLYQGASTAEGQKCTGAYAVLRLIETLPHHHGFKLFFDNWFCSLQLCLQLKSTGFQVTATVRADRLKGCPLPAEKELKKKGRGAHSYKTDANSGITVTKWFDNKCIQLVSTNCNPQSVSVVKRWSRAEKKYVNISCPTVVQEYNKNMGGVDLSDMLISLYRTNIKIKRWYLKVFFHCVDISKVNAWLLYRRHCQQLGIPKSKQLSLLKFTTSIASGMIRAKSIINSVGRPSKRRESTAGESSKKAPSIPSPIADVRFDHTSHWPEYKPIKRKCKLCKTGQNRVYCLKCGVCLCLSNERNCFLAYHTK